MLRVLAIFDGSELRSTKVGFAERLLMKPERTRSYWMTEDCGRPVVYICWNCLREDAQGFNGYIGIAAQTLERFKKDK